MSVSKFPALLLAGALVCAVGVARAEPLGTHQPHVEASLGARVSKVGDSGFDPFADSDELPQLSLGVGATALKFGRVSLAGVGFWDYGGRSSEARGAQTSLTVHRLSIGPELRYHLLQRLYLFAHALPTFTHTEASLEDSVAEATRYARHWAYGLDGGAGAAVEVLGDTDGGSYRPRFWAMAEGGYGYSSSTRLLLLAPSDSGAPQRSAPLDLGSLSLSGPFLRVSVAVSF
jgi:hypothetical protein